MASVTKRGSKYCVRYRYETETGEVKFKRVSGFKSKEEAWAAAKELERKSTAGIEVNIGSLTCAEVMERWFTEHCSGLAPSTRAKYSDAMDKLDNLFIAALPVKKLNKAKFNVLLDQLMEKVSDRTATDNTEPLRLSMAWAAEEGIIPFNPLINVKLPRIKKRKQVILCDADVEDLYAASISSKRRCKEYRIPLLLALYGGLRREECAALRWESIDFDHNRITISEAIVMTPDGKEYLKDPKTYLSARTISMPEFVMEELSKEYTSFLSRKDQHTLKHNPTHRVCVTSTGDPYSCKSYIHPLKRLIEEINTQREESGKPKMPKASFHDLRHTHAAMLIRRNVQPKVISERLGHASIKITMDLYGYLMPGLQDMVSDIFNKEKPVLKLVPKEDTTSA